MQYSSKRIMFDYSKKSDRDSPTKKSTLKQSVPSSRRKVIRIKKQYQNSQIFNDVEINVPNSPAKVEAKLNNRELVLPKLKR
jgi:hypothetical protein